MGAQGTLGTKSYQLRSYMAPKTATEAVLWNVKLPEAVSAVVETSGLEEEEGVSFRIAATSKAIRLTSSGGKATAVEVGIVVGEEEEPAGSVITQA